MSDNFPRIQTQHPAPRIRTQSRAPVIQTQHPAPRIRTQSRAPVIQTQHAAPRVRTGAPNTVDLTETYLALDADILTLDGDWLVFN